MREVVRQGTAITTTDFVLDEAAGLVRILGALRSDGREELYAYGPEGLAAQRVIVSGTAQPVQYALLDGQGSLRHLADASGNLTLSRGYDAWGSLRYTSGSATSRLGYTGELQSGALVYLRARWYHTGLGTFTARDTFMGVPNRPSSLHRYLYTEGNPVNFSDPSGQCVPEGRFFGDPGCQWIWDIGMGPNWHDGAMWFWHVFQNLGLPGAIASDLVNSLAGRPSNMADQIIQQDGRAAVLGGLFRDLATAGSGRLPQVAQLVAGWSFAKSTEQMLCSPASLSEQLGYGAQTVVLLLTLKGGSTTLTLPGGGTGPAWSTAAGSIWSDVQQAVMVTVPTQQLAGAVAGQPGLVVLLAKGNEGSGSGSNPPTPRKVYRVIRSDEDPVRGLVAKNPSAAYTPEGHVLNGSKANFRSQYISTTTDINIARRWASQTGDRIVEIDLTRVSGRITDLSTDVGRGTYLKGATAKGFAQGSLEVLIEGFIPSEAIQVIK